MITNIKIGDLILVRDTSNGTEVIMKVISVEEHGILAQLYDNNHCGTYIENNSDVKEILSIIQHD